MLTLEPIYLRVRDIRCFFGDYYGDPDTSASSRHFAEDITEPFVLRDGHLPVPTTPGIGIDPLPDVLARFTTARRELYGRG